MYTVFRIRVK